MTTPDSPFMSCPSAENFSSVFVENPDKISQDFQRCRPPRKRNSLTVSRSSESIFLFKPMDNNTRSVPPIAPLPSSSPARKNSTPLTISSDSMLKYGPK